MKKIDSKNIYPSHFILFISLCAITSIFILLSIANAEAQDIGIIWEKTYGSKGIDAPVDIKETPDGGYILAGYTQPDLNGNKYAYLLRLNGKGEKIWEKSYGTAKLNSFTTVLPTSDGGYICVGTTNPYTKNGSDVYLVKTDAQGKALWTKTYGGILDESGKCIIQTPDGGYMILGRVLLNGIKTYDCYVIKIDRNGKLLWDKTYSEGDYESCMDILATKDGGYVITGNKKTTKNLSDIFLLKIDAGGKKIWESLYGGKSNDKGAAVQQTDDGGYMVYGSTSSFGKGMGDLFLVKADAQGKELWNKTYGDKSIEYEGEGGSLKRTSDGGYLMCGSTTSIGNGNLDYYIVKVDKNGKFEWDDAYGTAAFERAATAIQTGDGNYVIAGVQQRNKEYDDAYVIKVKGGRTIAGHLNYDDGPDTGVQTGGDTGQGTSSGNGQDTSGNEGSGQFCGLIRLIDILIKMMSG
ncbi:hypothetical protein CUJ83_13550 [Methanocella sp. CWC-04]|uniref:Outer membrane protein assembly factor BamB, contains PQQ-like beta-propeller repeat n=1 Tax=Methanooceanicella nereidis TaxID=2052831 RepID=A0AAP2W745_9EURY|nr:hypothetical protein [Methanocella sp. CWC-04]MCD1296023.1 hypothetical protein [Methanocella sp. CWC-04]